MNTELEQISTIFESQKIAFEKGVMASYEARKNNLLALQKLIEDNEKSIIAALREDLAKSEFEGAISETLFTVNEIKHTLKGLKKWMKKRFHLAPHLQFPAWSWTRPEPLGKVLIISPWNYPFQLLMSPLIGALAAGNVVVLKPSEIAVATSKVIAELVPRYFSSDVVSVVEGAVEETQALLDLPFDHIFYTGNGSVGRIVMEKAAKHLCPVTLELGGKSPCLVLEADNISLAAKRIVWGKFFNTGQTCVAPDYILVHESRFDELVDNLKKYITEFFGDNPQMSEDYGRIISERHFTRLLDLINPEDVLHGGKGDQKDLYLEPTLVKADFHKKVMEDEIFGPILPLVKVKSFDEAKQLIFKRPNPLAAYLFSDSNTIIERFVSEIPSGGQCINDSIVHLTSPHLPFGGRGASGMGAYHGKKSFDTFSHTKSIMHRGTFLDLPVRYPPYKGKLGLIRKLLSWLG